MLIYWIIFLLLLYFWYKIQTSKLFYSKRKKISFAFIVIFICLFSLRSYAVGTDTMGYLFFIFPSIDNYSYEEIFKYQRDPVFYVIVKFVRDNISKLNIVWFFILSLIFWLPVFFVLKKYSVNIFVSLIVMMIFRYTDFPLNAMRNGIALSIAFFSMYFLIQKKFLYFLMLIFLGSLFHKSTLVMILIIPFLYIDFNKYANYFILVVLFVFIFRNHLYETIFIYLITIDPDYIMYISVDRSVSKILTYLIILFFFILTFVILRKRKISVVINFFYASTFLSLIFSTISLVNPAFDRISMYFGMGFLITIPFAVKFIIKKIHFYPAYTIALLLFVIIYSLGGPAPGVLPYSFFWNPKKNSTHLMQNARALDNAEIFSIYRNEKLPIIP